MIMLFSMAAGRPRRRADATKCDPHLHGDFGRLTEWLRSGIQKGYIAAPWEGDFPRYAWVEVDGTWYEARLVTVFRVPTRMGDDRGPVAGGYLDVTAPLRFTIDWELVDASVRAPDLRATWCRFELWVDGECLTLAEDPATQS